MIRSRVHRLPEDRYRGRVAVAFTANLQPRRPYFTSEAAVAPHRKIFEEEVLKANCIAYAYCFMPDHFHAVLLGVTDDARPKEAMTRFKQRSGFLFGQGPVKWQPRFRDHVLRMGEDTPNQTLYVLNNPLRAGLTENPLSYRYSGSVGISFSEVIDTILDL